MNKIFIAVLLICIGISYGQDNKEKPCWGEDCTYDAKGNSLSKATIASAVMTVDKQMRRVYWYYLRGARRLFQANIDTSQRFIHFYIYRNIVGTFLAIGSWDHETQASQVNTFVRLGNGFQQDIITTYEPVEIDPFVISLRMKYGETLIEIDQNGDIICNQGDVNIYCLQQVLDSNQPRSISEAKIEKIDKYIRQNYWYYIRGAEIVHREILPTNLRVYALFTYVNIVGTFLVIASCDLNDVIQVNTFVRLGAGSRNIEQLQPILLQPEIITAE